MISTTRTTVTRSTVIARVATPVTGLGFRMAGVRNVTLATALPPGANPSSRFAGYDPSRERFGRDCQSQPSAKTWQPAKPLNLAHPN